VFEDIDGNAVALGEDFGTPIQALGLHLPLHHGDGFSVGLLRLGPVHVVVPAEVVHGGGHLAQVVVAHGVGEGVAVVGADLGAVVALEERIDPEMGGPPRIGAVEGERFGVGGGDAGGVGGARDVDVLIEGLADARGLSAGAGAQDRGGASVGEVQVVD